MVEKIGLALKSNYIYINKNQQKWQKQNQPQQKKLNKSF
jgi:hypothetical protein